MSPALGLELHSED